MLIDAAAKLSSTPAWRIEIYGDGPQREAVQRRIAQHSLQHRITLHGYTDQPHAALQAADVFAPPSRNEGFGLVIAEAMLPGVQVVAADCPHASRAAVDAGGVRARQACGTGRLRAAAGAAVGLVRHAAGAGVRRAEHGHTGMELIRRARRDAARAPLTRPVA